MRVTRGMRGSPGIERGGPNTDLIDDKIVRNQVLTEIELALIKKGAASAAMYVLHLSALGSTAAVAERNEVSLANVRLALAQAKRVAQELLATNPKFVELVTELGFDTIGK